MNRIILFLVLIAAGLFHEAYSQNTYSIKGRVTDATSGDPIPFANIAIKASFSGATTNFDGFYQLTYTPPADSLLITYVGYESKSKGIVQNKAEQIIDIQLAPGSLQLREVKIFVEKIPHML